VAGEEPRHGMKCNHLRKRQGLKSRVEGPLECSIDLAWSPIDIHDAEVFFVSKIIRMAAREDNRKPDLLPQEPVALQADAHPCPYRLSRGALACGTTIGAGMRHGLSPMK